MTCYWHSLLPDGGRAFFQMPWSRAGYIPRWAVQALQTIWTKRTALRCGLQQAMPLPLRCPVSTSITWRNGIRFLLRVMPVSRIAYWTSVPVSREWNFHPDHHYSTINLRTTSKIWKNESEWGSRLLMTPSTDPDKRDYRIRLLP